VKTRTIEAFVLWAAFGVVFCACSNDAPLVAREAPAERLGGFSFQLVLDSGLEFQQVSLTLRFPDGRTQSHNIDLRAEDSTISAYVTELPAGNGYEVTLTGTSTTGVPFTGTRLFDINEDEEVIVMIDMLCGGGTAAPSVGAARVIGEVIPNEGECPAVIDRVVVAPARTGIGVPVAVEVFPTQGGAPTVVFSSDGGAILGNGPPIVARRRESSGSSSTPFAPAACTTRRRR